MKKIIIPSDYTGNNVMNALHMLRDDQGDVYFQVFRSNKEEPGVRIATDGGKHSVRVWKAFYHLVDVHQKELAITKNPDLLDANSHCLVDVKEINILSDSTVWGGVNYNLLRILVDDQGDIHIGMLRYHTQERGVRVASSGSRYSTDFRFELYRFMEAYIEEILDPDSERRIKKVNEHFLIKDEKLEN
jgi:hypothetical protein